MTNEALGIMRKDDAAWKILRNYKARFVKLIINIHKLQLLYFFGSNSTSNNWDLFIHWVYCTRSLPQEIEVHLRQIRVIFGKTWFLGSHLCHDDPSQVAGLEMEQASRQTAAIRLEDPASAGHAGFTCMKDG